MKSTQNFFEALKQIDYDKRISIEAKTDDIRDRGKNGYMLLKKYVK